jgi:hypothetical protein
VAGIPSVGDTLLFAATALLAGFGADWASISEPEGHFQSKLA